MGITDKISGRVKKAAGDLTDDASLRREGRTEERKGEAKDELANAQERADAQGGRGGGPGAQELAPTELQQFRRRPRGRRRWLTATAH